jgi:hypothetical protein
LEPAGGEAPEEQGGAVEVEESERGGEVDPDQEVAAAEGAPGLPHREDGDRMEEDAEEHRVADGVLEGARHYFFASVAIRNP